MGLSKEPDVDVESLDAATDPGFGMPTMSGENGLYIKNSGKVVAARWYWRAHGLQSRYRM